MAFDFTSLSSDGRLTSRLAGIAILAWMSWLSGRQSLAQGPGGSADLPEGFRTNIVGVATLQTVEPAPNLALGIAPAVFLVRSGQNEATVAFAGETLNSGDRLVSFNNAIVLLRLANGSFLRMHANSELTVYAEPGVPRPGALRRLWSHLTAGAARYFSSAHGVDDHTQVANDSASSIQTEYAVEVIDSNSTEIAVFSGAVLFTHGVWQVPLNALGTNQAIASEGAKPRTWASPNVVQWWMSYPVVLDTAELGAQPFDRPGSVQSMALYRDGKVRDAVALEKPDGPPGTESEKVYAAALRLAAGDLVQAELILDRIAPTNELAKALRLVTSVARNRAAAAMQPSTATGWLAMSYYHQSRFELKEALAAAQHAVDQSPGFLAGWLRVAELELGEEDFGKAGAALKKAQGLSSGNAQALALTGFLHLAENRTSLAEETFQRALALDSALANAWLGRGLCRVRQRHLGQGIVDLETAVALEPERAALRSYLAKALISERRLDDARRQLASAMELDKRDPTPWLYAALLAREEYTANDAVTNLVQSIRLNKNRQLFRSQMQLDQDEGVRRANVAFLFEEAGLSDWGRWEASRAVTKDYADPDAHLFLARSYLALIDPFHATLRYEPAALDEFFLASLLAPVGAAQLSPGLEMARPTELLTGQGLELISTTTVEKPGGINHLTSQQGHFGPLAYALDFNDISQDLNRPNSDLSDRSYSAAIKGQITPDDSAYLLLQYRDTESGDTRDYYDPRKADRTFHFSEHQWPNVALGVQHRWAPGQQLLGLFSSFTDEFSTRTATNPIPLVLGGTNVLKNLVFGAAQDSHLDVRSFELQELATFEHGALQVGIRYQNSPLSSQARLYERPGDEHGIIDASNSIQDAQATVERLSVYAYQELQLLNTLHLTLGLSYDDLRFPQNIQSAPFSDAERNKTQLSPKLGLLWEPGPETVFAAAYTRSLGGVLFDTSIRLEPSQVVGFDQAFRSLIPESLVGTIPGTEFETYGISYHQAISDRLYLVATAEHLRSRADHDLGAWALDDVLAAIESTQVREKLRYGESRASLSLNYLLGRDLSLLAQGSFAATELEQTWPEYPAYSPFGGNKQEVWTETARIGALWNHPSGFLAQLSGVWIGQDNRGAYASLEDESRFQLDAWAGFRFPHRTASIFVGVLNLTDQDYHLSPLSGFLALPRERTFITSVSFAF